MSSTTADPGEIAKFDALAKQWWDSDGPFRALHLLNPVRLGYIRERALAHFGGSKAAPLAGVRALDIGCGGGLVSGPLARMGAQVTAIDAAPEAIGAARAYGQTAGLSIDFQCTTAEALTTSGERYDMVVALEIIEHVSDLGAFLSAASALVRPGGLCVLSTINRTPKARVLAITAAERILRWAPLGAHSYDKLVTPDEIRAGAPDIDWDAPVGIAYNRFGAGWGLSRDTDVNYLMAGA